MKLFLSADRIILLRICKTRFYHFDMKMLTILKWFLFSILAKESTTTAIRLQTATRTLQDDSSFLPVIVALGSFFGIVVIVIAVLAIYRMRSAGGRRSGSPKKTLMHIDTRILPPSIIAPLVDKSFEAQYSTLLQNGAAQTALQQQQQQQHSHYNYRFLPDSNYVQNCYDLPGVHTIDCHEEKTRGRVNARIQREPETYIGNQQLPDHRSYRQCCWCSVGLLGY